VKRPPAARPVAGSNKATGYWVPYVVTRGALLPGTPSRMSIALVRNVPTLVSEVSSTDPYGPSTATLSFPGITLLDEPGEGDLWWLTGEADVDIHWFDVATQTSLYIWEGTMQSFDWAEGESASSLTVTCQGALLQVDHFLAVPKYPYQPIPYEIEIGNQFQGRPSLRLAGLSTVWPSWWTTTYNKAYWDAQPLYRRPVGLNNAQRWTGTLTRATGNFEPSLQHIGNLLGSMFTERGQWTLMLEAGRRPVLRHRDRVESPISGTLVVDLMHPGVKMSALTKDHSQKVNAVFANGTTIKGVTFNGMRISPDGAKTWYEPYAARRQVEPAATSNRWLNSAIMRREVAISFSDGASEDEARIVAERHLGRYADAGLVGSLTLSVDPLVHPSTTTTYPRQLVRAGQHIQVKNLFGRPNGVLFHITESTSNDEGTTLTVDSKYRDQLTVQEVRARGRDAMAPTRLLSINEYKPTINDALFPWSYARGSGYIPRGSNSLFAGMPQDTEFPWEEWTRKRPPRHATWRSDYIRIGPASRNADLNWARKNAANAKSFIAFSVRLSQAGEAKLFQIAAYDRNGNVMQVPFHVAFYKTDVGITAMPWLTAANAAKHPPYKANQRYPFFDGAFESFNAIGQVPSSWTNNLASAGLMAGWGNYWEKAGYWPGSSAITGNRPTGLLSLNNPGLSWNLSGETNRVDLQKSPEENLRNDAAGIADVRVMIYCDAQASREVFFLGRIFRQEQAGSSD
jgi:hypothetical protein